MATHKFAVGDVVKAKAYTSSKDVNRRDGIVKHLTCQGATKAGGGICDRKTCKHAPKDRIWVKWPNEELCSYSAPELQLDIAGEDALLEESQGIIADPSADKAAKQMATKSMEQLIRARALRKQAEEEAKERGEADKPAEETESSVLSIFKADATKAAYRVATNQINNGVRNALVEIMRKKGSTNAQIEGLMFFLDTEIGAAFLSILTGYGLQYAPMVSKDSRIQQLSKEFRISGMTKAGNEIFDKLLGQFLPIITSTLANLPAVEEENAKVVDIKTKQPKSTKKQGSKRSIPPPLPVEEPAEDVDLEELEIKEESLPLDEVGKETRRSSNGH